MRISDFFVTEFGALRGFKGTLGSRLTVVWGENGSGKTTLSRFFQRLLSSGWETGETPPQGKGTLSVVAPDGQSVKIELDADKILPPDLTPRFDDFAAGNFLPFVFSPAEAQGASGMKKLDLLERRLYAPGDSESRLGKIFSEIENSRSQAESLQNWSGPYWELHEKLEEKREALKNAEAELEKNRLALVRAELIVRARPAWFQARELRKKLEELPSGLKPGQVFPIAGNPGRGLERLRALQERISDLRIRVNERRRKNAYESSRRRQMENNPIMTILKYGDALEELELELGREGLTETAAEAGSAEAFLKKELADIAPLWSEGDLLAADLSLAAERRAHAVRDAVRDLNERARKIGLEKSEEERKAAAFQAEVTAKPSAYASQSDAGSLDEYHARRETLLEVRRKLLRSDALRWEIRGEKACAGIIENELENDGQPPARSGSYMAKLLLAFLLSLSGISVAVGSMAPALRPYDFYAALFCILATLGPALSIMLAGKEHAARLALWKEKRDRRNGELDFIDEKIIQHRREMQALDSAIEKKAKILGVNEPLTLPALDEAARQLESERRAATDSEVKEIARKQAAEELEKCDARLSVLREKLSGVMGDLKSIMEDWKNWLLQNRFTPELTPESFGSFLTAARAARTDLKALESMRLKLAAQREREASVEALISGLDAKTGLQFSREGLPAVFASLKEARSLKEKIDASLEERSAADFEIAELESELASAVGAVMALCKEAGAESEDELRVILERQIPRASLAAGLEEAELTLAGILGEDFSDSLGERDFLSDALSLAEEIETLKRSVAAGEKSLTELRRESGELEVQMESMASGGQLFTLRQRSAALDAQARKVFTRWLAIVLLKHLSAKSGERGVNSEPDVLEQARKYLSLMAGPVAKLERAPDGTPPDQALWNSGLAEQFALSVKLAAACDAAGRNGGTSPLILDEVLAHFDENGQRGAIEALWQVSEKTQIIYFTCHRYTAEMFRAKLANEKGFSALEMPRLRTAGGAAPKPKTKKQTNKRR